MTLVLPDGLVLQKDGVAPTFSKTVYFQSGQRTIDPKNVVIDRRNGTSYAFNITFQLNLGETITFYTNWTTQCQVAGIHSIHLLAFSKDTDVDPQFRTCEDTCEVQVVEDVPVINEPLISPTHHLSDIGLQEAYVYPGQDIEVRCNVTSPFDVKNVTLHYSTDTGDVWSQITMSRNFESEWVGTVPGQSEGKSVLLYVEAYSSSERSSKTTEHACIVSDLQALEVRIKVMTAATATVIAVGCTAIFIRKRRRVAEAV